MSTLDDGTGSGITGTTGAGGLGSVVGGTATVISEGGVSQLSAEPDVFQRAGASRAQIHKAVPNGYEPTTDWFAAHRYYTPAAINNFTQEQMSRQGNYNATKGPTSVTTGSGGAGGGDLNSHALAQMSGGGAGAPGGTNEDPTGFFPSAQVMAKKNNLELQVVCDRYKDRETSNLSALHSMLYPSVTQEGKISVEHVKKVVQGIAVPHAHVADFVMVWFMHLGVPVEGFLPYDDVMSGLYELFNGSGAKRTADQCFKLCAIDPSSKFILRDQIVGLKPAFLSEEEQQAAAEAAAAAQQDADLDAIGTGGKNDSPQRKTGEPAHSEHLTFLIVKAVLRCFEHVAHTEEDRVRATQSKGKKKKKNQVLVMPSKRQFHISHTEFKDLLAQDPYLVVAFLPYAMMISTEV